MKRKKTGNNQLLKQINEAAVLDLVRTGGKVSRVQLSQYTGLSATAIGMITSKLVEQGYIYETGIGQSSGGRKPVMLELKPRSFYSVGIDIDTSYINMVLLDIKGDKIYERLERLFEHTKASEVFSKIEDIIKQALLEAGVEFEKLVGIGISIPGIVDAENGIVVFAPNLGWENVEVKNHIKSFANIPVYIENEAMASAICENWLGCCKDDRDFVCINIKSGIGAGIFTGGRLYRGSGGSAGEVGHITVDENGPKCGCGSYGCLETLASSRTIVDKTKKLIRQGTVSSLNKAPDVEQISLDDIVDAARNEDEAAKAILMECARYMGIAITNIVNSLNPSKIVLGKDFAKYSDIVLSYLKNFVLSKALKYPASRTQIISSEMGEGSSTLGAAIVPLKVLFGK